MECPECMAGESTVADDMAEGLGRVVSTMPSMRPGATGTFHRVLNC